MSEEKPTHKYSPEELLNLWAPSEMPKSLKPFGIVASIKCLQPVSLLPIEERRQYQRSYKGRPKRGGLSESAGEPTFSFVSFFFFLFFHPFFLRLWRILA